MKTETNKALLEARTVITVATCSSRAKAASICATMPGAWIYNVDKYTFLVQSYSK